VAFAYPVDTCSLVGGSILDPCSPTASLVTLFARLVSVGITMHLSLLLRPLTQSSHFTYRDRTGQVAVLAQLFLDPYYRTREGFSALVQKDFMSFGHPFHTRCAHGEGRGERDTPSGNSGDEGQISPIFIQFLDCVYQIVNQYPECFEFNTKYLLVLSEHVYSSRFGTMLCDTERERELVAGIRQRTHSLWDYLDERDDLVNPSFHNDGGVLLMPLPTLLRNVSLWVDRHCMHGPKPTMRSLPTYLTRPPPVLVSDQQSPLYMVGDLYKLTLEQAEKRGQESDSNGT